MGALILFALSLQIRENVTVELIEVPVYVTDAAGEPIRGLTKDRFELKVNRRGMPIDYFDFVDLSRPRAATEAPIPLRERRLYLLMFDRVYASPGLLARAQRAAIATVKKSNRDTDLFAVATYTSNKGVQFALPFVSDRAAIGRAIATLRDADSADPLGLSISDAERGQWIAAMKPSDKTGYIEGTWGDEPDLEIAETLRGGAAFQDMSKQPARYIIQDLLFNFGDLATRLRGLEGQKHVVVFSSGFDMALVHGGSATAARPTAGGGLDSQSLLILKDMFLSFRASNVFLDTIDVNGVGFSSEALSSIAHGTGGEYIHNRNDLKEAMSRLTHEHDVVYMLAFNRRDNRAGTISVSVKDLPRGATVSYRQGFGKPLPATNIDPLQLVDILTHDVAQTGINLTLDASSTSVALTLPNAEISAQVPKGDAYVDAVLYIFDSNGSAVLGMTRQVNVSAAEGPVTIRKDIQLPPGHYVAKAVARIDGTSSLGFARREFTVE